VWEVSHSPSKGLPPFLFIGLFQLSYLGFLLGLKAETYDKIIQLCSMVINQFGLIVQKERTDNETEFAKRKLPSYFLKYGILSENSCMDAIAKWEGKM